MCIIFVCESERPRPSDIERGMKLNPDGAGIVWRESELWSYHKGFIALDEIIEWSENKPLPYVLHFRKASCGVFTPRLCHPFPICRDAPLAMHGESPAVLFHNGHFKGWTRQLNRYVVAGENIPDGPWSDTRLLAFVLSNFPPPNRSRFLKRFRTSRFVLCDESGIRRVGLWQHRLSEGIWISNNFVKPTSPDQAIDIPEFLAAAIRDAR